MKKTVPLSKELKFDNIAEITSIALDHDLNVENAVVVGNLVVSGSYKMTEASINTDSFKHVIPVNIEMNSKYDLSKLLIEVDDFYYEIVDSKSLNVSIEIGLNNLTEKELIAVERTVELLPVEEESRMEINEVKTLFDSFDESVETYSTYKVYILKENDNVESVCLNYSVTKETLEIYNDLSDLKIGDKIIIPNVENDPV